MHAFSPLEYMYCCCPNHFHIGRQISRVILGKQLKVEGFLVYRWYDQWPTAFKEMAQWIQEVWLDKSQGQITHW